MDKFTLKNPNLTKNTKNTTYKFLSFFIFKGQAYPVGSRVDLTDRGENCIPYLRKNSYFIVNKCYFQNAILRFDIEAYNDKKRYFGFGGTPIEYLEDVISNVIDDPINDNHQEYIDFINRYQTKATVENFTKEEAENIKYASINNIPIESIDPALEEKVKHVEAAKRKACDEHKDWEYPELIVGWIVFIVVCILLGIFEGFWNQFILRMIALVYFMTWREKTKLEG